MKTATKLFLVQFVAFFAVLGNTTAIPETVITVGNFTLVKVEPKTTQTSRVGEALTGIFQAFSGDHCDGNQGLRVIVGTSTEDACIHCDGRHSFSVGSGSCTAYQVRVTSEDCGGNFYVADVTPGCWNVNTGGPWESSFVSCS